jgi:hypothetical protein
MAIRRTTEILDLYDGVKKVLQSLNIKIHKAADLVTDGA